MDDPSHPKHDQIYQAILRERFGFDRTLLLVRRETSVTGNKANMRDIATGTPPVLKQAGGGGGIFARRDDAFKVLSLRILIDDFLGTVRSNSAAEISSNKIRLFDATKGIDVKDATVSTVLNGDALDYKS